MYPINVSVFYRNNDNVFKLQKYIFDRVSLCWWLQNSIVCFANTPNLIKRFKQQSWLRHLFKKGVSFLLSLSSLQSLNKDMQVWPFVLFWSTINIKFISLTWAQRTISSPRKCSKLDSGGLKFAIKQGLECGKCQCKMLMFTCYILVVELVTWSHGNVRNDLEPTCYSRFDYDHKLITALVTLELKWNNYKKLLIDKKLQSTFGRPI